MINKELYNSKCIRCIHLDYTDHECRKSRDMNLKTCNLFISNFTCNCHPDSCNGCNLKEKCDKYDKE